jgi:hypothetical protein
MEKRNFRDTDYGRKNVNPEDEIGEDPRLNDKLYFLFSDLIYDILKVSSVLKNDPKRYLMTRLILEDVLSLTVLTGRCPTCGLLIFDTEKKKNYCQGCNIEYGDFNKYIEIFRDRLKSFEQKKIN